MDSPARVEEAAIGWVPLEGTPAAARWRGSRSTVGSVEEPNSGLNHESGATPAGVRSDRVWTQEEGGTAAVAFGKPGGSVESLTGGGRDQRDQPPARRSLQHHLHEGATEPVPLPGRRDDDVPDAAVQEAVIQHSSEPDKPAVGGPRRRVPGGL